ncbi:MAG TPA: choice-of-anchor tandem repeat GloVer-containing protein, partial [Chitinophagaceae bacterium]
MKTKTLLGHTAVSNCKPYSLVIRFSKTDIAKHVIIFFEITLYTLFCLSGYMSNAQVLYGTSIQGGSLGGGTITKFQSSNNTLIAKVNFENNGQNSQYTQFVQTPNGKLYCVTSDGGSKGYGIIFSFDPVSSVYAKLKDFNNTDGARPRGKLVLASDGKLYGTTFLGGTNDYGVIFSWDPSSSSYTKLIDFNGTNGRGPSSLIPASDGKLYGVTINGGSNNKGVVFSFDPASSTYTKLKDFAGPEGSGPVGGLIQASNGQLYGMTNSGGSSNNGAIFSFDPSLSSYTKLKDFDGTNGKNPSDRVIQASDGKLYGMTTGGGSSNNGVIFSFDLSTLAYSKLKDFDGSASGSSPNGSLIQASDGKLYGLTNSGGARFRGVMFSFNISSSTFTKLIDFNELNGSYPNGTLFQASDGKLYGLTPGSVGFGIVFSFSLSTSTLTVLHEFAENDNGLFAYGSLIKASDGKLYGMTGYGGSNGVGVIFSFDPVSSMYNKLKDLDLAGGSSPHGSLMQASDGKLYGMTYRGGSNDLGVIFSFDLSTSIYTKLKDFNSPDGAFPFGSLIQAADGKLYGMTSSGGTSGGVIFSFDPSSLTYTKLYNFTSTDGYQPNGTLIQATDGKLYGITHSGGNNFYG